MNDINTSVWHGIGIPNDSTEKYRIPNENFLEISVFFQYYQSGSRTKDFAEQ